MSRHSTLQGEFQYPDEETAIEVMEELSEHQWGEGIQRDGETILVGHGGVNFFRNLGRNMEILTEPASRYVYADATTDGFFCGYTNSDRELEEEYDLDDWAENVLGRSRPERADGEDSGTFESLLTNYQIEVKQAFIEHHPTLLSEV